MDHKQGKIVNDLRFISNDANLAYCTENFVFSALYKNFFTKLRPEGLKQNFLRPPLPPPPPSQGLDDRDPPLSEGLDPPLYILSAWETDF